MVVQTLIMSKDRFKSVAEAKAWLKENDFKDFGVDETEKSYRFRQRNPEEFQENTFRTITITNGVSAVGGRLKNVRASSILMSERKEVEGQALEAPKFYYDMSTIQLQDSEDKESESKSAWVEMMSPIKDQEHGFFGKITITADDIGRYKSNFDQGIGTKANELPIDYWHTPYKEAAGWLKKLEVKADNSLWGFIEFTPKAVKMVQDKEVRFFSPQFSEDFQDSNGKVTKNVLTGGGLTNLPFLNNSPISLSENFSMVIDLDKKTKKKGVEYGMEVIQLSDGRAIRAVDFLDMEKKLSEAEVDKQTAETKATEAEKEAKEKTAEAKQLSDKAALAEKEKEDAEWDTTFKQLSEEGKATPGMKESLKAKFNAKELAEFGKSMPKVLSDSKVKGTSGGKEVQLSEAESGAMGTFNYTEEQIREGRGE